MNERVKAIFTTAIRLSAEERTELARILLETIDLDPAEADRLIGAQDDEHGNDAGSEAPRLASDVLAKYLDI